MRFVSYMTPGFPPSLFQAIAARLDADLHLETEASGPPPGTDPFGEGRFDLGWICSTSYVDLALRSARPSIRLGGVAWVPDDPDVGGRPVYFGDVVVRADSPVETLLELRGRLVGCNDPVSLSGHHALRYELEQLGQDPDRFADLRFTGGHHRSLDLMAAGELDAAVVDSVVRVGRSRHDADVARLRVVDRLGPWPVQPLVASATMSDEQRLAVSEALLSPAADASASTRACGRRTDPPGRRRRSPLRAGPADHAPPALTLDAPQRARAVDRHRSAYGLGVDMRLELVPIPVADIDDAVTFYTEMVGFGLDHDVRPAEGVRVAQLTPSGSACSIVLAEGLPGLTAEPGTIRGLHLVVDDIDAARRALDDRGVEIDAVADLGGGVRMAGFADPDGNTWTLQQLP